WYRVSRCLAVNGTEEDLDGGVPNRHHALTASSQRWGSDCSRQTHSPRLRRTAEAGCAPPSARAQRSYTASNCAGSRGVLTPHRPAPYGVEESKSFLWRGRATHETHFADVRAGTKHCQTWRAAAQSL